MLDPTILVTRVMRWPTVYDASLRRLESLTIGTVIAKAINFTLDLKKKVCARGVQEDGDGSFFFLI